MAFEYIKKPQNDDGIVESSPYWILAVVPFSERVTFDMDSLVSNNPDVSKASSKENPTKTNGICLLDSHCIKWSVQQTKSNYVHSASFTLVPPSVLYEDGTSGIIQAGKRVNEYDIAPQDWVLFWAMDNEKDYIRTRNLIGFGTEANGINSGLKFVGRVSSFRSTLSVLGNGTKVTRYQMDCHGFREFDNTIYYNPLSFPSDIGLKIVNDLADSINEYLVGNNSQLLVTTQNAIPVLTRLFFDVNFLQAITGRSAVSNSLATILQRISSSPNKPYLIPEAVAKMLGYNYPLPTFYDILFQYVGIEQYWKNGSRNPSMVQPTSSALSAKDYWSNTLVRASEDRGLFEYSTKLNTEMVKQTLHFDGRPVWSVLGTYLNAPVTEMYTTLKMTPEEMPRIMPSLVCRQLPFTSTKYADSTKQDTTKYAELPRWQIDDSYILSYNIGMSDSMDVNYVHLEPFTGGVGENQTMLRATNLIYSKPFVDTVDISRNGLRIYQKNISAFINPGVTKDIEQLKQWTGMVSDIMMRMKHTSSGSVSCKGVQEPVAVGDNLVLKDTLFHIEGVTHEGGIEMNGTKFFNTNFTLTYGIKQKQQVESLEDVIPQQLKDPSRVE